LAQAAQGDVVDRVVASGSTAGVKAAAAAAQAQSQAQAQELDAERQGQLERNYRNLLSRMGKKAKMAGDDGSAGDTAILVTYGAQAGMTPMRVYRDLRRLGLPRQNALVGMRKQWPAFSPERKLGGAHTAEEYTLIDAIRDLGGIAEWSKRNAGRSASVRRDYAEIPLWLRNNKEGTPMDQLLPLLAEEGFIFEDENALYEAVRNMANGGLEQARNPVKALQDHEQAEADDRISNIEERDLMLSRPVL
jgi:hypothetical protein